MSSLCVLKVLPLGKNAGVELEKQIADKGYFWQALPPLRPETVTSLGCGFGAVAASQQQVGRVEAVVASERFDWLFGVF